MSMWGGGLRQDVGEDVIVGGTVASVENPEIITVKLLKEDIGSLKRSAHLFTLP